MKLKKYRFSGNIWNWMTFLISWKVRVIIEGDESSWTDVKSGVPQGSVMGPRAGMFWISLVDVSVAIVFLGRNSAVYRKGNTRYIQMR